MRKCEKNLLIGMLNPKLLPRYKTKRKFNEIKTSYFQLSIPSFSFLQVLLIQLLVGQVEISLPVFSCILLQTRNINI